VVTHITQNNAAVETNFGEFDAVVEEDGRKCRNCTVVYACGERDFGVIDFNCDSADGEAVRSGEGEAGG
ncbi:hypothetical protein A2U01_0116344, partial [Trifolium medium]|nr:hypothetical protein [Trifolium medium]